MIRSRLGPLALALCLAAGAGCSSTRGLPPDLSPYRSVITKGVFAWAWGGAKGYDGDDEIPVRVDFAWIPGATRYRLLRCNPSEGPCESAAQFVDLDLKARPVYGGLFGEFRTGMSDEDAWLLVIADRDDELLASEILVATPASRPTTYAAGGISFDRGEQQLDWPRVPDAAIYVLTMSAEKTGDAAVAVSTHRKSWAYAELLGIVRCFHDPASVTELRRQQPYGALLFALNGRGWATLMTDVTVHP